MPVFSQGSTVTFDGDLLGSVLGWTVNPGTAQVSEVTGLDATTYGTGGDARIVKQRDCTAVDPGSVSVRLLGCPPYTTSDVGSKGMLNVAFDGGSVSAEAILTKFEVEGQVGDLLRGSAEFEFTGD